MTPTRSIGEQVAEIIGWKDIRDAAGDGLHLFGTAPRTGYPNMAIPKFETSVDAAMTAYAVMRERGWYIAINWWHDQEPWVRLFRVPVEARDFVIGNGPTLALAICQAIIAASGKAEA